MYTAIIFLALLGVGYEASALALRFPSMKPSLVTKNPKEFSQLASTSPEAVEDTSLILKGSITTQSESLPVVSRERLSNFFRNPAFRNLLVSGGGERPVEEVDVTEDLLEDWKAQCKSHGVELPDDNDSILSVVSRGIEFPGLKVKSTATVGVKFVEKENIAPRHEFVLLATQEKASGLPPVVWIYNKLTGADKKDNASDNSKAKSLSTVTYEATEDGKVKFRTNSFLQIGITFPKVLLKILPSDKATIEEKASSSIEKTLMKDVVHSMKAYAQAYSKEMHL
ncbi:MAG: hypothetical protein SGILL_000005 [Bacillariaceae sp.]